jgi:8-oxo-dGTP diphosphatase
MSYTYKYPRPAITVDALITAERDRRTMILLILRKSEPFRGRWALPGGFAGIDELLEDACKRELEEETGLKDIELKQFHTFDAPDRDPRERIISVVFHGQLDEPAPVKGGDDAQEAKWFPITSLPEMAFDHQEIIKKFVRERDIF